MAQTSRRPAGWTSAIWPDDIGGLAEYVGERLTLFREFMDRNPAYWMREQVSSSFIRRKPNPRIVRARIGLAVDCLNQARRWVDSRKLNGVPDLCTPASEAEAEESLSRLYRSLRVIADESEPKPPSLAGKTTPSGKALPVVDMKGGTVTLEGGKGTRYRVEQVEALELLGLLVDRYPFPVSVKEELPEVRVARVKNQLPEELAAMIHSGRGRLTALVID